MSSFGVTPTGFVAKTVQQVEQEIIDDETANISPNLNTQSDSILGIINGIFADIITQQWEVAQDVYSSAFRSTAQGAALDGVGELTGVIRLAAAPSTAEITINVDDTVTVPIGTVFSVSDTGQRFTTTEAITNTSGFNANFVISAESEEAGPISGPAGTIANIQTPVTGLNNTAAFITSAGVETFDFSTSNSNTLTVRVDNGNPQTIDIVSGVETQVSGLQEAYNMTPLPGTLDVAVDNGAPQTVTFVLADFAVPTAASAAEVAARVSTDLAGATGSDNNGFVQITSNTVLPNSSIRITGGSKAGTFNFPNPVAFTDPAVGTAAEVSTFIDPLIVGGSASVGTGPDAGKVVLTSDTVVGFSSIKVDGGTANTELMFDTVLVFGTPANQEDATLGRDIESDADYRARQEELLSLTGAATVNAIQADVLNIENVESATVFENVSDTVDAFGRFPHSIEIIIDDPLNDPNDPVINDNIGTVILDSKAAGINTSLVTPTVTSDNPETYALAGGETISLRVDTGDIRTITLTAVGVALTAATVAGDINTQFGLGIPPILATASSVNIGGSNFLQISSNNTGVGGAILLTGGTALAPLSLTNKYEVVVTDSQGIPHAIRFARAEEISIKVAITVQVDSNVFTVPDDAIDDVQNAIVALGNSLGIGVDVKQERIKCAAFEVDGVLDVTVFFMETGTIPPAPTTSSNIAISGRQKAVFDTSDVEVTAFF